MEIQPLNDQDVILWPNGHWEYRANVDPVWLQDPAPGEYETVAFGTTRWSSIVEA